MTVAPVQQIFPARESGDVGEARRAAVTRAAQLGFDETTQGRVALVVTEVGTNLIKHAGGGHIIIGTPPGPDGSSLEVLAVDRGPGIPNTAHSLQDGFSTAGSSGNGLGGIRRLSGVFDLYSVMGAGTVVLSRVFGQTHKAGATRLRLGAISLPVRGETDCGDGWGFSVSDDCITIMVADGLGHGRPAFEAAQLVLGVLERQAGAAPEQLLQAAHGAARGSRGAAAAAARIDPQRGVVSYAGVGNIAGQVVSPQRADRSLVSGHGVLGGEIHRIRTFDYPFESNSLLVLHSDGISSRWDLANYPGIHGHDPGVVAGVLYRDFARERDDATVVACAVEAAR